MKLKEILLENEMGFEDRLITDPKEMVRTFKKVYPKERAWVGPDGRLNVEKKYKDTIELVKFCVNGRLIINFGSMSGMKVLLPYWHNKLSDFSGLPHTIHNGELACIGSKLERYDVLPKYVDQHLNIGATEITSLVGISDYFTHVPIFSFHETKITEGGLGILLLPNLRQVWGTGAVIHVPEKLRSWDQVGPFNIIMKYFGRSDDIFECQAELIEKGFEEFAKL